MKQWAFVLAVMSTVICQTGFLYASCPATYWVYENDTWVEYPYPDQIFCDDFDSYCVGGGPPGTPNCPGTTSKDNNLLRSIWYNTSAATMMSVDDVKANILYDVYSGLFSSKFEDGPMGQQTVRDWVASPPVGEPNQILDFSRRIGEVHGSEFAAVIGSDTVPLSLTFAIGTPVGKLWYSSAYMELAFGTHEDLMNMANTDYAIYPKAPCCNGTVANGPWPLLCAQGNPAGGIPADSGCPMVGTTPPPVRNVIAVGNMAIMDTDPCHCGPNAHYPQSYNLTFYDGQVWWTLNSSAASLFPGSTLSGERIPWGTAPVTPPANYPAGAQAGNFYLYSPSAADTSVPPPAGKTNRPTYRARNTVTLTLKRDVVRIELSSDVNCSEVDPNNPAAGLYYTYTVTSVLDNVPLKYAGPFDRLRAGVGPGCELASDADWSTCKSGTVRSGLLSLGGYQTGFDRVVLYGGIGYSVKGACCNATDGACTQELESECVTHGRWTRSSQSCEDTLCCPSIYGDDDHDGSVDMSDFAALQRCVTIGGGGAISPSCMCFDFDGSDSINASDVQHFADCAMGPSVPGSSTGSCEGRLP